MSVGQSKQLVFEDKNYEDAVGMVTLRLPGATTFNTDPVIPLGQTLLLDFDLIGEDYEFLHAKLIHCTYDWQQSEIRSLDFLNIYNEFSLDEFNYSSNTLIPYTRYQFRLPPVTKSGNYLLVVYRDGDEEDLLFTRRMVVYENLAAVNGRVLFSQLARQMQTHQRIDFEVRHPTLNIFNPLRDLKVILLQNHNWYTAIRELQPTVQRPDQRYLEFHHFTGENEFPGNNEFRFFDLRATQYRGRNINAIFQQGNSYSARLGKDISRKNLAYTNSIEDENGAYFPGNTDPGEDLMEADYIYTSFFLETEQLSTPVYITGKWNNWRLDTKNEMEYEPGLGLYIKEIRLKQGFYNFAYATQEGMKEIEGSFPETENQYEVLVYFTDPSLAYHRLIGYTKLASGN
ncbi:MAG: DUF5103 domain-containing protein [Cytophagales bacterium]|nr:DUF5103 domain-containing protein [Cytophagales bacterium]